MTLPQAQFGINTGFTNDDTYNLSATYNYGIAEKYGNLPDQLKRGVSVSFRNLSDQARKNVFAQMEADGKDAKTAQYLILDQSTSDDAVYSWFNKRPVQFTEDGAKYENTAKVTEWYCKSLGLSDMELPTNDLNKAMTSNVGVIHAYADNDIVILNSDVQILQGALRQEAAIGKDVMVDIQKPWNFASPYFGTELQDYVDSDFELNTFTDQLYFMYNNGEISTAALNFAMSANPRRDLMPMSVIQHQLGCRALRERRLLGIDSIVNNTNFTWEDHTPGLNYAGLHEIATNRMTNTDKSLSCIVNGNGIYGTGDTEATSFGKIMRAMSTVMYRGKLAGQNYNLCMTDWQTAQLFADNLYPNIRVIDNSPTRAFGITSLQVNTLSGGPIDVVVHPWMPSASGQSCMFFIDTQMMARRIGWLDVMQEIPNPTRNSKRFTINSAETFIDKSDYTTARNGSLMGAIMNITHPDYAGNGVIL